MKRVSNAVHKERAKVEVVCLEQRKQGYHTIKQEQ